MSKQKRIETKSKMSDYKTFSIVLLLISSCFSMGAVIPFQGRTFFDDVLLSLTGAALLIVAGFFYLKSGQLKQQIEE